MRKAPEKELFVTTFLVVKKINIILSKKEEKFPFWFDVHFNVFSMISSFSPSSLSSLASCAVNPRPFGRGYKALKNNVFY